jgi:hypothetical protein
MVEFSDRTDLDRGAFLAHLRGARLPRAPRFETALIWIFSLMMLGLQVASMAPTTHRLLAWIGGVWK